MTTNLAPLTKLAELLRQDLRLDDCSTELQSAISAGETAKVLRQVETELETKPDDLLLRALWVKYSLRLESIPLSVFVSPVSSLLNETTSGSKQVEVFVAQSSLEYIDKLLGKNQFTLAADVGEALQSRVGRSEVGLDLILGGDIQELLNACAKGQLPIIETPPSSHTISDLDLDQRPIEIPSSGTIPSSFPSADPVPSSNKQSAFAAHFQKVKTPVVLTLAAGIMVVGLRSLFDQFLLESKASIVAPIPKIASAKPMPTPIVIGNLELGPDHSKRLDSVNERVKGLEIVKPEEQAQIASNTSTTSTTQPGLTKAESAGLAPIGSPDKASPAVTKRLPDVSGSGPVHVSNLDAPDIAPRLKDLTVGRDGKLYGPSVDKDPYKNTKPSEEMKTLDGKPVHSYEVQNFSAPRRYRTIVLTKVLTAPSMLSTEVARLQPDAKIVVISAMGPWLELRSKNGLRGYIYSQDAIPDEEE